MNKISNFLKVGTEPEIIKKAVEEQLLNFSKELKILKKHWEQNPTMLDRYNMDSKTAWVDFINLLEQEFIKKIKTYKLL